MSNPNVTIDRHKYIGGSDLPNILGLNIKYGTTTFEFAKEKAGISPNSFTGNQFTKYGQVMEPLIRDYINSLFDAHYHEDTIIDKDKNYRGNTDGIDRDAEYPIIEIKTFGEELDVEYYTPQCQFYMETFNVDRVLLVGYKRPSDFYTGVDYELENSDNFFNFEFDETRIETHIIERDKTLWNKIENRIIAFKKAVNYLRENRTDFNETDFNNIFYGNDVIASLDKIALLETKVKDAEEITNSYKEAKEQLYKLFEEKGILSLDTGTIKITKVSPTSYDSISIDSAKLKENETEIYNKYKVVKKVNKKGYILITNREVNKND